MESKPPGREPDPREIHSRRAHLSHPNLVVVGFAGGVRPPAEINPDRDKSLPGTVAEKALVRRVDLDHPARLFPGLDPKRKGHALRQDSELLDIEPRVPFAGLVRHHAKAVARLALPFNLLEPL